MKCPHPSTTYNCCLRFVYDLMTQCQNVHYLGWRTEVFKCFNIFASEFGMRWACDEKCEHAEMNLLLLVTEGVVHRVYKVITRSSFSVTRRHKASGGKWTFHHCVTTSHTNMLAEGQSRFVQCQKPRIIPPVM